MIPPLTALARKELEQTCDSLEIHGDGSLADLLRHLLKESERADEALRIAEATRKEVVGLRNLVKGMEEHLSFMVGEAEEEKAHNDALRRDLDTLREQVNQGSETDPLVLLARAPRRRRVGPMLPAPS